ncbi:ABC transporter substrate-binding protein [Rhizobium sp. BGM003]|nr:ABC transporter substrate-binding protein [Rhizobium phaseoli]
MRQPTFSAFKGDVTAQSQAMPAHMLKGSIAVVGDFFNNRNLLTQR